MDGSNSKKIKNKAMIILHVANLDERKAAGPNINVPQNVIYGNKYEVVGLYNLKKSKIIFDIQNDKYFSIVDYKNISELPEPFNRPDIVVFQGMYEIEQCRVARELVKKKIPYIVVPRCSMTTAAIKSHELKKRIANILFFNSFIKNAEAIQFLTENEYEESKNSFRFKNYYILGNGIELPTQRYKVKKRDYFKIVFVGRYNVYHKGLDVLLDAVKNNKDWFNNNNVVLCLYGSDSDNGLRFLESRVKGDNIDSIVKICGPVFDNEKKKALLDADVFIHTSRLEGQPTSVIEAIGYGVPVIVTPGTNVSDVVIEHGLGFVAQLNPESVFDAIATALNSKKQFSSISENEINYAKKNFDWDGIVKESIKEYNSIMDSIC